MKRPSSAFLTCALTVFVVACRGSASETLLLGESSTPPPAPRPSATPSAIQPTDTIPAPSRTPTIEPSATEAAFDFARLADKWLVYRNETYGFTFEYPAVYAEGPYSYCDLQEFETPDGGITITVGMRSDLYVFDPQGQTIEDYVDSRIEELKAGDPDWELTDRAETTQAGVDAISITYRFGSFSRIGDAKVFKRGEVMYIFNLTFGAFCDVLEIGLYEWDVFPRMVSSFNWLDD